ALTTTFQYDRAGRVTSEIDPHGQTDVTVYDKAGNVIESRPRHLSGGAITMVYDVLGRMTDQIVPSTHRDSELRGLADFTPSSVPAVENPTYPRHPTPGAANDGYDTPADTATFTYDAVGNILTANNWAAEVSRTWNADGTLASETLDVATVLDTTFNVHEYTTDFEYDVAGRLEKIKHPQNLWPSGVSSYETVYDYDAVTGGISQVTDPEDNTYTYGYDLAGRIDAISLNGEVDETMEYYPDGLLKRHQVTAGTAQLRDDQFTYDPRGKLIASSGSVGLKEQFAATYAGLGYLMESTLDSDAVGIVGNDLHYFRKESFQYDGLGSQISAMDSTEVINSGTGGGSGSIGGFNTRGYTYFTPANDTLSMGVSRLASVTTAVTKNEYEYDLAGNTIFTEGFPTNVPSGAGSWDDRATYYNALGQVAASERRTMANKEPIPDGFFQSVQEDYRYDALGRRILVRTRRYCDNHPQLQFEAGCSADWVRRTVWANNQELWEIQMPDATDTTGVDLRELDVGISAYDQSVLALGSIRIDNNPYFGRVAYTYGANGVDKPVAVHRYEYSDHPDDGSMITWPRTTNMLLWNFRGQVDNSRYSDGSTHVCDGPANPTRCIFEAWPPGMFAYNRVEYEQFGFWHGSVPRDKRDATGTHYRRNRYYDPNTGQFTQEDPIGLAGGLNLYGFAGGDPINFSDPFGLMPCDPPEIPCDNPNAAQALAHFVGGSGAPLTMSFLTVNTSSVRARDFPDVDAIIGMGGQGTFEIDDRTTLSVPGSQGLVLGNITLSVQGTLTVGCEKLCEFNFRGTLKAFDDVFDFNPSTHRSVLGEAATAVGRAIP
ncbi:MAG: lipid II-degrading bacteriocin, partial [Gemmatimonadetes bacterium]|nr:lipid II-degrading bacteriocin [Gemmatimonadota bacterium]